MYEHNGQQWLQLVRFHSDGLPRKANDPKRFIEQGHCTSDGEVADKVITSLNQTQIDTESKYDGLYAVCTNLEYSVSDIIRINQKRWEIEECFRIMKTAFKARPVYLSRKDRITAHFTTCFTALIIYRILEKKLNEKYEKNFKPDEKETKIATNFKLKEIPQTANLCRMWDFEPLSTVKDEIICMDFFHVNKKLAPSFFSDSLHIRLLSLCYLK